VLGRSFQNKSRNKSSKDMAFPHPRSRNDKYRNEDKPNSGGVVWNFFKRTINITEYRNAKDDVNPAKNRTFAALVHDWLLHGFAILLDSRLLSRLRRPVGRFNTELLGVLRVQPLPAAELHGLGADDASNRSNPASPATRRRATPTTSPTWPRSCRPCAMRARTT
jgi:hypothetical protein